MHDVISARRMPEMIAFLSRRRSTKIATMGAPGPDAAEIRTILTLAARVPDHGKLAPWRFIVIDGDARKQAGTAARAIYNEQNPDATPDRLEIEENRFCRAPLVIGVVSRPCPHEKIPEWEQILSSGAACLNLCLSANALGYASVWLSEWCAYDRAFAEKCGLEQHERFAGFIHIGTPAQPPTERERPDIDDLITRPFG